MLGKVHSDLKVPNVRLSEDERNVQDPRIAEQLHSQLRDPAKKYLQASLPRTSGPWHTVSLTLNRAEYRKRHAQEAAASRALFKQSRAKIAQSHMVRRCHLSGLGILIPGNCLGCLAGLPLCR